MKTLILPALLLLAACQTGTSDPRFLGPPQRVDLSACGGDPILDLMGQNVSLLPATGAWGNLRVIGPGMAVTEDYSESRLNVEIDGESRIIAVYCG